MRGRHLQAAVAGLAVTMAAATPAVAATPTDGAYTGKDSQGREVGFSFKGRHLHDFDLGVLRANREAYVTADGRFGDREYHHILEGEWTTPTHVKGTYSYYRDTRRGLVKVVIHWTASLASAG
ncbi:MAG: hypothetical protein JWM71_73 [Solirubrobacteraceae bacterium]|nr:hypothetical protein [Solirubrobacteraceae bacterium]